MTRLLVAIGITGSLAVAPLTYGETVSTKHRLSDFDLVRFQFCGSDNDCMVAINGCCDCANGGETVAVSKDRFDEFKSHFDCAGVPCGMKEAVPACDRGVVTCVRGRCRYVSPEEFRRLR
jgi:hypothetical protein